MRPERALLIFVDYMTFCPRLDLLCMKTNVHNDSKSGSQRFPWQFSNFGYLLLWVSVTTVRDSKRGN